MDSWDGTNSMNVLKEAELRGYQRGIDDAIEALPEAPGVLDSPTIDPLENKLYGTRLAIDTMKAKLEALRGGEGEPG